MSVQPYQLGPYRFTPATIYDEAKPPAEPGVYLLMLRGTKGGKPAVRYVGKAGNLKQRLRLDHEHFTKLFEEAGRDPDRVYVAWHTPTPRQSESMKAACERIENIMIAHFGKQIDNEWKNTPTWKERQKRQSHA
ncbi:MAG TPA: hypothetical protein V6C99_08150 [Oculatellaceae cyanobacterium]|jgi:DNA polymerase/3'-5' exonuclease PolX